MCGFGVFKFQFELVVPMSLPNCTVGCGTITATHEPPFTSLKKKKKTNEHSQNVREEGFSQGQGPFLFYFFLSLVVIKIDSIDLVKENSFCHGKKIKKEGKNTILVLTF